MPTIYVAPWGNDASTGLDPNAPKASLGSAVGQSRATGGSDTIVMRGGDYYLTQKVTLGGSDNGLVITSQTGERATLHGGPNVAGGWSDYGGGLYSKNVSFIGGSVEDMHANGARVQPARFPNGDPGNYDYGSKLTAAGTGGTGTTTLKFKPGDLPGISDVNDLRINVFDKNQWSNANPRVQSIDYNSGTIYLKDSIGWHNYGPEARFYLYNSKDLLDRPGEFDYDSTSKNLLYRPQDASVLNPGNKLVAATLDTLIDINGGSGIKISGLGLVDTTHHGSDRAPPWSGGGGGAVRIVNSNNITVDNNVMDNVGVGVSAHSVSDIKILGNTITDAAGTGVHLAPVYNTNNLNYRVEIGGNKIINTGQYVVESGGVFYSGTQNSWVHDNYIQNAAQLGIYEGQIRSNGSDRSANNVIEYNVLKNINTGSADGGAIKVFSLVDTGGANTIIRHNFIEGVTHSMSKPDGSMWGKNEWYNNVYPEPVPAGIYLDTKVSGIEGYGNLIKDSYTGIYVLGGSNNNFHDNVLYSNVAASIDMVKHNGGGTNNRFAENIVVLDQEPSAAVRVSNNTGDNNIAYFQNNLYSGWAVDNDAFLTWSSKFANGAYGGNINQWQQTVYQRGGEQLADPLFVNPGANNFALASGSPAWGKGFDGLSGKLLGLVAGAPVTSPPPAQVDPTPPPSPPSVVSPPPASPPPASPPSASGSTTIKVVAAADPYGNSSNPGPWPQLELLVNGQKQAGPTAITVDRETGQWQTLSFDVGGSAASMQSVGVKFINDFASRPYNSASDRNLWVDKIQVGSSTFEAEQAKLVSGGGGAYGNSFNIWSNGTLQFDVAGKVQGDSASSPPPASPPPPAASSPPTSSGKLSVLIDAAADPYGNGANPGPWPQLDLLVNGNKVAGPSTVTTDRDTGQWQRLSFDLPIDASSARTLGIKFTNDWASNPYNSGSDRNLFIQDVTVQGKTLFPGSATFLPESGGSRGGGNGLYSNGTLQFDLDKLVHNA